MKPSLEKQQEGKKGKKRQKKYKFTVPEGPSKSAPPGPAYSPQTFTFTRVVQYFANLTDMNNDFVSPRQPLDIVPLSQLPTNPGSQTTNDLDPQTIFGLRLNSDGRLENSRWKEGKHRKHQGKQPRRKPHPKGFAFQVEYDTQQDKGFADLTVRRWIEYARRIGQSGSKSISLKEDEMNDYTTDDDDEQQYDFEQNEKGEAMDQAPGKEKRSLKAWDTFVKRAFVGTMDRHEMNVLFHTQSPVPTSEKTEDILEL